MQFYPAVRSPLYGLPRPLPRSAGRYGERVGGMWSGRIRPYIAALHKRKAPCRNQRLPGDQSLLRYTEIPRRNVVHVEVQSYNLGWSVARCFACTSSVSNVFMISEREGAPAPAAAPHNETFLTIWYCRERFIGGNQNKSGPMDWKNCMQIPRIS